MAAETLLGRYGISTVTGEVNAGLAANSEIFQALVVDDKSALVLSFKFWASIVAFDSGFVQNRAIHC
jgi:hypothetical protein